MFNVSKFKQSGVTSSSVPLIDHIYTTFPDYIKDVQVPIYAQGDHYPVSCILDKLNRQIKHGVSTNNHREIKYRNFKTDRNCKQIWKHLKDLNHSGKNNITSLKTHDNDYITNLTDIVEHLNDHFSSTGHKLVPDPKTTFFSDSLASFVKSRISENVSFTLYSVSISEVSNELVQLDVNITGLDKVGPRILKLSSPIVSDSLAHIINLSLFF
ncbi:unnamed protein product [Mytilus coruscus]|uniref:Uncharacterized protein n=1 Tax=Mytilus coruscus TaxID=42192 RepID=A0A6J8C5R2_MYTCO|nr:unnamed protein product [Mytilus coruscus]